MRRSDAGEPCTTAPIRRWSAKHKFSMKSLRGQCGVGRSGYATDRKSRGTLGHAGGTIYNLLIADAQRTNIKGIICFDWVINAVLCQLELLAAYAM
jgi:hypothetical protein